MPTNLNNALGIHEYALNLQARRAELLSSNIANADTPNYKAQDIDFQSMLADYAGKGNGPVATHARHFGNAAQAGEDGALYRTPTQPSVDGNTVDPQVEKAAYMENALRYQATLDFVNGTIKSLRTAITGQ